MFAHVSMPAQSLCPLCLYVLSGLYTRSCLYACSKPLPTLSLCPLRLLYPLMSLCLLKVSFGCLGFCACSKSLCLLKVSFGCLGFCARSKSLCPLSCGQLWSVACHKIKMFSFVGDVIVQEMLVTGQPVRT